MEKPETTQYVLEVFFDAATTRYVRALWARIDRAGYPSPLHLKAYEPHLTLLVLDDPDLDVTALRRHLTRDVLGQEFSVDLVYLGLFMEGDWVVFLGAVPGAALLALHRRLYALVQGLSQTIRGYFAPSLWVPHVTLSFDLSRSQALRILELGWEQTLPHRALAKGLRLVEVGPAHAREVFRVAFAEKEKDGRPGSGRLPK